PNNVAPPEQKLLLNSIEQDGFTQPLVVVKANTEESEIVDGFHRHELGQGKAALKRRLTGYLPIPCLDRERHERMAATI
ncbi:ParB N-terminal domain-containing protein, partial [Salmonella enterica subsp. enterica serovar Infantis]